ncbi:MAG: hypothetical protein K0Q56_2416, partial [Sporolactobacillus laevolacticus]|nr:hypothetical protein [Sporolactobacillus laevolacticus]
MLCNDRWGGCISDKSAMIQESVLP